MRVDHLTEDEWETLRDLRLRALTEDGTAFGSSIERERGFKESHWRMRLRASPWFVAVVRDGVAGMICVIGEPGAPAQERHLVAMWVAPEHRGVGAGAARPVAHRGAMDEVPRGGREHGAAGRLSFRQVDITSIIGVAG